MKFRNMLLGTVLALAVVCGGAAAMPGVTSLAAYAEETERKINEELYVKTQNMEYTTDRGETVKVAVSANRDDSTMLMRFNFYGDNQHAKVKKNADGQYVAVEGSFFGTDAVKVAEIASENGNWSEM